MCEGKEYTDQYVYIVQETNNRADNIKMEANTE